MLQRYVASTVLLVPITSGGHWQHQWTDVWRWGVPLQWCNQLWRSLDEGCRKVRHRVLGWGVGVVREHSSVIQSKVYSTVLSTKQNPKLITHNFLIFFFTPSQPVRHTKEVIRNTDRYISSKTISPTLFWMYTGRKCVPVQTNLCSPRMMTHIWCDTTIL